MQPTHIIRVNDELVRAAYKAMPWLYEGGLTTAASIAGWIIAKQLDKPSYEEIQRYAKRTIRQVRATQLYQDYNEIS